MGDFSGSSEDQRGTDEGSFFSKLKPEWHDPRETLGACGCQADLNSWAGAPDVRPHLGRTGFH